MSTVQELPHCLDNVWSSTLPTIPGYYWYKAYHDDDYIVLKLVYGVPNATTREGTLSTTATTLCVSFSSDSTLVAITEYLGGYFQPIQPPVSKEIHVV